MIGSEALPFAKTGGLADVLGALPKALTRLGHAVDLVMPRYRGINVGPATTSIRVALGGQVDDAQMSVTTSGGLRTIFVGHNTYFDREYLYGVTERDYPDNPERFAFFCQAALNWATSNGLHYDVVHAHDWQTGLVPVLMKRAEATLSAPHTPTVFTIHNLAYQGIFDASWLPRLGLGWDLMRMDALEYWGRISYLKGGVLFSDLVTTVSPTYAQEIQTPELGFGFDGILRHKSDDLVGILNGIDYDQWDPDSDVNLPAPYNASKLKGKGAAKRKLLEGYGLPAKAKDRGRPLIGMISRMVDQKGFDLIAAVADELPKLGAGFVVLGTGDRRYEDLWRDLAAKHPTVIAARIGFDEALAHLIEGGADIFLMPSRFEPCGLNQMYSLRYGTIPVVRATGGLNDTVLDVDPETCRGTGFRFVEYTPQALLGAIRRALAAFGNRPLWRRIQKGGMRQDFSWDASAREYVDVYERAARRVRV
ncbi:MAG TPA: glycogen synthase GlgA [Vicinamibacterales bacterium]|jgi:starch synthase|nr:glycogen synthase GlgA [Vicinamibacterales bacterium]